VPPRGGGEVDKFLQTLGGSYRSYRSYYGYWGTNTHSLLIQDCGGRHLELDLGVMGIGDLGNYNGKRTY